MSSSGASTLVSSNSDNTCLGGGDSVRNTIVNDSAYWVSALLDSKDTTLLPTDVQIRYSKAVTTGNVSPFPTGFTMISGAGQSQTTTGQGTDHVYFQCQGSGTRYEKIPQDCTSNLLLFVTFQDCWNGVDKTKSGSQTHIAYSSGGACPSSHTVALPQIRFQVTFSPIVAANKPYFLSSDRFDARCTGDGGYSIHGDWMNGWDASTLSSIVSLINSEGSNVNVRDLVTPTLRPGNNIAVDPDDTLTTNMAIPKCGCSNGADLSKCPMVIDGGGGGGGDSGGGDDDSGGGGGGGGSDSGTATAPLPQTTLIAAGVGGFAAVAIASFLMFKYVLCKKGGKEAAGRSSPAYQMTKSPPKPAKKGLGSVKGRWPPDSAMV